MHNLPQSIMDHAQLRTKRRALEISQEELARMLSVSRTTIVRVENGEQHFNLRLGAHAALLFAWLEQDTASQSAAAKRPVGRPKTFHVAMRPVDGKRYEDFRLFLRTAPAGYIYERSDVSSSNNLGPWVRYVRGGADLPLVDDLRESESPVSEPLSDAAWLDETAKRYEA